MQHFNSTDTPNKQPASVDELVDFIARTVRDHYERTKRGVAGSVLAYLLRQEYPGLDFVKLGITRLGDAVNLAVARELVQKNLSVTHLEVLPYNPDAEHPPQDPNRSARASLKFVKPELWRAAVLAPHGTHAFFHRRTGEIKSIESQEDLAAAKHDPELAEIESISEATQQQWLRTFLQSRGKVIAEDDDTLSSLLRGDIRQFGSAILQDWKFLRSRNVVEHIRQWARRNTLPETMVLVPPSPYLRKATSEPQRASDDRVRQALLAALAEMPLEELERLIPFARYLLRHFIPK